MRVTKITIVLLTMIGCLTTGMPGGAQNRESAKADGKAFASEQAGKARDAAATMPDADRVPGYDPNATQGLSDLARDPDRIAAEAQAAAPRHEGQRAIDDSARRRARFEARDIEAATTRASAINAAPLDYTSGMAIGGAQGRCVPLPPGTGSAGSYFATCNKGMVIEQAARTCTVTLEARVETRPAFHYLCSKFGDTGFGDAPSCEPFQRAACQAVGQRPGPCLQWSGRGPTRWCVEPGDPLTEMRCQAPVAGQTPFRSTTEKIIATTKDDSQCRALAEDSDCTPQGETCSGSDPVTRIIDGVPVTRPCWAWQRSYQCTTRRTGNDCGEIEANSACRFVRGDCLSEDTPCKVTERVYECPLPGTTAAPNQYVCDGDVYCIDGSCETIEREANDEFAGAVTALHAMDEARGQFDPASLTLFKGTRETCSSQVFGLINCCKGKGFPLVPGIGLLVSLGCDKEEVLLHERDAKGLCAYIGSYCSGKILGICTTKRKAYCCFESKLSRILQEQGRKQLPKPWGKAKSEQCAGFTTDEFARLDLSEMDFSEVYAEFTEAARLPDELETSALIQQKITDYFERSGR